MNEHPTRTFEAGRWPTGDAIEWAWDCPCGAAQQGFFSRDDAGEAAFRHEAERGLASHERRSG